MIDYSENLLHSQGRTELIEEYAVFWNTPVGLCEERERAMALAEDLGFDPRLAVRPVVVARGDTLDEVCSTEIVTRQVRKFPWMGTN